MWFIIEQNKRKTTFFLIILTLFFLFFGSALGFCVSCEISDKSYFGTYIGLGISFICLLGIIIYTKFNASKFFLNQVGAVPIKKEDLPVLHNAVEEMSISASLGFIPKIYIIDSNIPNAFSVGINEKNAAVAVTTGLLSSLNRDELQGVIAHEIAHIKNLDTLYLMYAGVVFGLIVCVSNAIIRGFIGGPRSRRYSSSRRSGDSAGAAILIALILAIISPILVKLLYLTVSRKREYLADACACQYTRYPSGLASALTKISNFSVSSDKNNEKYIEKNEKMHSGEVVSCMYIHNFLQKENAGFWDELFSTHPSTKKRISVLKQMGACDFEEYNKVYRAVLSEKSLVNKNKLLKMNLSPIPIVAPVASAASETAVSDKNTDEQRINRQREAKDSFKKASNYKIINCDCNVKLKIPPELKISEIACPNCNRVHKILG